MNKRFLLFLSSILLLSVLVACSKPKTEVPVETKPAENKTEETVEVKTEEKVETDKKELRIAMVSDEGGVNDQSFNEGAWDGLKRAKADLGVDVGYIESHQTADFDPNFEQMHDDGYDLVWGVGFKLTEAVAKAAESNSDTLYGLIDGVVADDEGHTPENVVNVLFKAQEPSFLVGYIAGKMTETNKVGFVGGIEGDIISGFEYGYRAGVAYAAKELEKDIEVLSQYAVSFSDVAKGKSIATNFYQQGADIVFHAAGGVGDGVIEAAKEQNKWAIGVDKDQSHMAPDNVLTSAMKRVDVAIYNVVKELTEGKFDGGQTVIYGLQDNGAVDIAPTSDKHIPAEILKEVDDLKAKIINGEIVPSYNIETFEEFMKTL